MIQFMSQFFRDTCPHLVQSDFLQSICIGGQTQTLELNCPLAAVYPLLIENFKPATQQTNSQLIQSIHFLLRTSERNH